MSSVKTQPLPAALPAQLRFFSGRRDYIIVTHVLRFLFRAAICLPALQGGKPLVVERSVYLVSQRYLTASLLITHCIGMKGFSKAITLYHLITCFCLSTPLA
jgi:hypothetical protein